MLAAVREGIATRGAFGLDADPGTVKALLGSTADVGTAIWGFPLTPVELEQLDLGRRMAFADVVDTRILGHLRTLATFGGAYFDQAAGGALTIGLTRIDQSVVSEIADQLADQDGLWRVVVVERTERALDALVPHALHLWRELLPDRTEIGIGTDAVTNGLFIEVVADDEAAVSVSAEIASRLDVPVELRMVPDFGVDTDCTSRTHCHAPTRAGINIYGSSNYDPNTRCTMGFHVRRTYNGDKQFLSAGHCGYLYSNWYHQAIGLLGSVQLNIYANGYDVMRVQMPDSEASPKIYGEDNLNVTGSGTPVQGETPCASLGAGSNTIKCGVVESAWRSWLSETAGYTVWGGDMSYATIDGDSGSPVYRVVTGSAVTFRAIGINTHEKGYFARVDLALTSLSVRIVN